VNRLLEKIVTSAKWLTGSFFLLLFLFNIVAVCLRYFSGVSLFWIPDLSRFLFIWIVFAGAAVMEYSGDHLGINFVVERAKPRTQARIALMRGVIMVAFLLLLVYQGIEVSLLRMRINFTTPPLPTGYAFLAVPVSAAIMLLVTIRNAVNLFKKHENDSKGE
jgi:TRAP-type transport system small permease protein